MLCLRINRIQRHVLAAALKHEKQSRWQLILPINSQMHHPNVNRPRYKYATNASGRIFEHTNCTQCMLLASVCISLYFYILLVSSKLFFCIYMYIHNREIRCVFRANAAVPRSSNVYLSYLFHLSTQNNIHLNAIYAAIQTSTRQSTAIRVIMILTTQYHFDVAIFASRLPVLERAATSPLVGGPGLAMSLLLPKMPFDMSSLWLINIGCILRVELLN